MNGYEAVKEFHEKHGFPVGPELSKTTTYVGISMHLVSIGTQLKIYAATLEKLLEGALNKDPRICRAHLMLEELGETIMAMGKEDEPEIFDGLCDLLYVVFGAGVAFDLPLDEGFKRVHESNMTKAVAQKNDPRLRVKGDLYTPPALDQLLLEHRRLREDKVNDK